MSNTVETELKLRFINDSDAKWQQVAKLSIMDFAGVDSRKTKKLRAIYYDTPDFALKKAGLAYRVRKENEGWVATVKTQGTSVGGLSKREEYSAVVLQVKPNIEVFRNFPVAEQLRKATCGTDIIPLFEVIVNREIININYAKSSIIELAFDTGEIIAGDRHLPILEIELELITGQSVDLLRAAASIAAEIPLSIEDKSKYLRGLLLRQSNDIKPIFQSIVDTDLVPESVSGTLENRIAQLLRLQDLLLQGQAEQSNYKKIQDCILDIQHTLILSKPTTTTDKIIKAVQTLGEVELCLQQVGKVAVRQKLNNFIRQGRLTAALFQLWSYSHQSDVV